MVKRDADADERYNYREGHESHLKRMAVLRGMLCVFSAVFVGKLEDGVQPFFKIVGEEAQ
jgi:hypothetical protein